MKQLLITLVAVVLGSTAMSSYANKPIKIIEIEGHSKAQPEHPYLESNVKCSDALTLQ